MPNIKEIIKNKYSIITLSILPILIFFCLFLLNNSSKKTEDPTLINKYRNIYQEARKLQKEKKYNKAYSLYEKISPKYVLHDIIIYQQALCAIKNHNDREAIKKLKELLNKYPKSPIAIRASYNLGQAYIRINKDKEAEKQFLYTLKNYPESNYAYGSYYYLGGIYFTENKQLAINYWIAYLKSSENGRFLSESINGLKSLKNYLSIKDKKYLGIGLYNNEQYNEAISYLSEVPIKKSWFYLAKSYEKLKTTGKALNLIQNGIEKYPDSVSEEEMREAMNTFVSLRGYSKKANWDKLVKISTKARDFALYNQANLVSTNKKVKIYNEIAKKSPNSYFASESLWNVFWDAYKKRNYSKALNLGKKHLEKHINKNASPKILFWIGKIYEKKNNKNKAKLFYQKLIKNYADSYYAFRAKGRLNYINNGVDLGWKTNSSNSLINDIQIQKKAPFSHTELKEYYNHTIAELIATKDYKTALKILQKEPFLESWLELKEGFKSKSIVLARNKMKLLMPKFSKKNSKWKLIYPVYYADIINKEAKNNNIDPYLIISLTRVESYFNPVAVSCSNARGLMQLLPTTARDVARWNNFRLKNTIDLFKPEINIKFGTAYLNFAKTKLRNNEMLAVAAYNEDQEL